MLVWIWMSVFILAAAKKDYLINVDIPRILRQVNWRSLMGIPSVFGERREDNSRIYGGRRALIGEFPSAVEVTANGVHLCGGVIVGKSLEWIITAAHCDVARKKNYLIRAGMVNRVNVEPSYQEARVSEIIIHPKYPTKYLEFHYDIALMKITPPFQRNMYVMRASIGGHRHTPKFGTIVGWGRGLYQEPMKNLQVLDSFHIYDLRTCREINHYPTMQDSMTCAWNDTAAQTCDGDSGSPMYTYTSGAEVVYGIVVAGYSCYDDFGSTFLTKIDYFKGWIKSYVSDAYYDVPIPPEVWP